jgi:serine phosphatase RsbU (regulator of sigma subunit)
MADHISDVHSTTPDLERDLSRERFAMRSLLEFARTLTPDLGPIGILKSIQRTIMGKTLITDGFAYLSIDSDAEDRSYKLVSHSGLKQFPFPDEIDFEQLEGWLFSAPEGVRTTLPIFDSEQNEIIAFLGFGKSILPNTDLSGEDTYLESLSLLAGMAITNARLFEAERERERFEAELRLAREIQQSLLPAELPKMDGFSFAALSRQSELVGGDYYDVLELTSTRVLLVIADVVGKGISAAILMSNVQASLHALLPQVQSGELTLAKLAERLNKLIAASTTAERFVTAVFAIADSTTNDLEIVVCGHPRPIIVHDDHATSELTASGLPLGVLTSAAYCAENISFDKGTSVFLYTDGLSEAVTTRDGKMLGINGAAALAPKVVREGVGHIEEYLNSEAGVSVRDDLTLVVANRI